MQIYNYHIETKEELKTLFEIVLGQLPHDFSAFDVEDALLDAMDGYDNTWPEKKIKEDA